jgi:1,2-diacylglycerol 3-alpha-glucosyltransferase
LRLVVADPPLSWSADTLAGMDILMLSDVYFPRVNGVSTSIRTFAKSLVAMGHRVTLVVPDYGVGKEQRDRDAEFGARFEVIRVSARVVFFDPEDRLMRAGALRALRKRLAGRRWDVIHVHTPFAAHWLGVQLGRMCTVPVVETYHTYFEEYIAHYLPLAAPAILRSLARRLSRRVCHAVDHVIVPTPEMADLLAGYGVRTPATVLPTGIDLSEFAGGSNSSFRQRHGIDPKRPVMVTISRLAIEKNIAFLLRVARVLLNTFPTLLFVIAGEGPDAGRIAHLVETLGLERNVLLLGNLDRRTELLDCYRAANAFVFASPTETQGLVLIEAMALGVPIVSTAVMGTATVLRGSSSAIVSTGEVGDFADRVGQVLRDPALQASLSAAGPRDAERWASGPIMRRVVGLYDALARSERTPPRRDGWWSPPAQTDSLR